MEHKHPWRARLMVGIIMLVLAFIGMIVTNIRFEGGWAYWKWMVPIYALLALWLSWYERKTSDVKALSSIKLYHEVLHWAAVIAAIFLTSFYVNYGVTSRFIAGMMDLTILSLGVFLAGVYIDPIFLVIGLMLGVFALISALVIKYFYLVLIPVVLACLAFILFLLWARHPKQQ